MTRARITAVAVAATVLAASAVSTVSPVSASIEPIGESDAPVVLSQTDDPSSRFGIDYNPERDEYLVAWMEGFAQGTPSVSAIRVDADGAPIGTAFLVAAGTEGGDQLTAPTEPSVTYNPTTDQYLVSFNRQTASRSDQVRGVLVSDTGTIGGGETDLTPEFGDNFFCSTGAHDTSFDPTTGGYKIAYNVNYQTSTAGADCVGLTPLTQRSVLQSLTAGAAIGAQVFVPTEGEGVTERRVTVTTNPSTGDFMVTQEDSKSTGSAHIYDSGLDLVESIPLSIVGDTGFYRVGDAAADPLTGNWLVTFSTSTSQNARVVLVDADGDVLNNVEVPNTAQPSLITATGDGGFALVTSAGLLVQLDPRGGEVARESLAFNSLLTFGLASNANATDARVVVVGVGTSAAGHPSAVARRLVAPAALPLVPARILETRTGEPVGTVDGEFEGIGKVVAGDTVMLKVTDRAGVPSDAAAVILNVAAAAPEGNGFVTAYPCGADLPLTANLNYATGSATSAAAFVKVGDGGNVCLFTSAAAHLIVDVNGFVPGGGSVESLVPARLLETRDGPDAATIDGEFEGIGRVGAGSTTELEVTGRGGVDADASAVLVNVAAIRPDVRVFLTVYPCGSEQPTAANLNAPGNSVINNLVLAKVGVDGKICVFSSAATDLVVDVAAAVPQNGGLTSIVPARFYETRGAPSTTTDGLFEGTGRVSAAEVVAFDVAGRGDVDPEATGVMLNVAAIAPSATGFMTAFPCDAERPTASNVNFGAGAVVSNAVFVKIGASGQVCVFSSVESDLAVDVTGYVVDG